MSHCAISSVLYTPFWKFPLFSPVVSNLQVLGYSPCESLNEKCPSRLLFEHLHHSCWCYFGRLWRSAACWRKLIAGDWLWKYRAPQSGCLLFSLSSQSLHFQQLLAPFHRVSQGPQASSMFLFSGTCTFCLPGFRGWGSGVSPFLLEEMLQFSGNGSIWRSMPHNNLSALCLAPLGL